MGIVVPRPQMRSRERRTIEARLRYHHDLMTKFESEGMSREAASDKAFAQIKKADALVDKLKALRKRKPRTE